MNDLPIETADTPLTMSFQNVWMVGEEQMCRLLSHILVEYVFDDRGELEITPSCLEYRGKKTTRRIQSVKDVSLFEQRALKPVLTFVLVLTFLTTIVISLSVVMLIWALVYSDISFPFGLTILNWAAVFAMPVLVLLVWFLLLSNFGLRGGTWWLKVDYWDETNQLQTSYFADGSKLGWGGKLGGTRRIYEYAAQMIEVN